jgi:hypothetical protein
MDFTSTIYIQSYQYMLVKEKFGSKNTAKLCDNIK